MLRRYFGQIATANTHVGNVDEYRNDGALDNFFDNSFTGGEATADGELEYFNNTPVPYSRRAACGAAIAQGKVKFGLLRRTEVNFDMVNRWVRKYMKDEMKMRPSHIVANHLRVTVLIFVPTEDEIFAKRSVLEISNVDAVRRYETIGRTWGEWLAGIRQVTFGSA